MANLLGDSQARNNSASKEAGGSWNSGDVQILIEGDRRKSYTAKLRRVATGTMEVVLPLFLGPSQSLEVLYCGCRVQSRVIRCTELSKDSYLTTIRLLRCGGTEMRAEPRLPVHLDAILQVFGSTERFPVTIIDISQSGLGVRVPVTLAVGQHVAIDMGHGVAMGEIRYCGVTQEGKRAGLQVLEFLERELPVAPKKAGLNEDNRPGLARVMALIRNRHDDIIQSESDES